MKKNMTYMDSVHHYGRIWGLAIAALLFAVPLLLCIIFKAVPNWNGLAQGLIATLPMYWAVGFIEIFTYVPMLGAGGTYLSFVTGNISNLKLPCAVDAMDRAGVKATGEEPKRGSQMASVRTFPSKAKLIWPSLAILTRKAKRTSGEREMPAREAFTKISPSPTRQS